MNTHRLAVLHTVGGLVERFKPMIAGRYPELDTFHMLDESLLQDLMRHGPSEGITERVKLHVEAAERAGATLLLFTCSSTSPAVDAIRPKTTLPIVKIDDAMAARAVTSGSRIGIMCTTNSTVSASRALIEQHAQWAGRSVAVETDLAGDAFKALSAGDRGTHDAIVSERAQALAARSDVLVLAQASMAHLRDALAEQCEVPVLASPELCVDDLGNHLR
ncbi:Asp/Glu/hydantoin racemase [Arsenicitalea aurantiaca]|uniref:Asp/Glu/hydantoin racemase n=1 Tax=Arsenicitalea aurantiaca TaxID=1783274 RepID=A0A433X5B5_9HYPH|nr:aspartate/glutamate racemase family protein [Arsenicitalea aurantiaca]RUT29252.1 Asp/Glu/hydantoin racemase [Arsenicitalea aurantiaca]